MFATPVYGQNQAPSTGKVIGANDRIRVGYIGTGRQGQFHISNQKTDAGANNIEQVAVSDLSQTCMTAAQGLIGKCDMHKDYEKLLERKDIDAVTIAPRTTWHAKITMDALEAGKHIYVEKPMARYLPEAYQVYDKAKTSGKIVQVGAQGTSAAGWQKAAELIKAGNIGTVVWGQGYYCRNSKEGEWNTPPIPGWVKAEGPGLGQVAGPGP